MIQQRTQIDPVAARLQDPMNGLHVLEDHRRRIDEEGGQHAVPLVLLVAVAIQELSRTHGEVRVLLHALAGNDVRNANTAVVIACGEDVVRVVRPRVDGDLRVRE